MADTSSKQTYILHTQKIGQEKDAISFIVCTEDKLDSILTNMYEKMIADAKRSSEVVGYFVYNQGNEDSCIKERVNPAYTKIEGQSVSRV